MTSRLLLTLLALLTGLSAQGGAVHARAVSGAMPGTMQVAAVSTLATVQSARAEAVLARPAVEPGVSLFVLDPIPVTAQAAVRSPAVLTQVDRAHE